MSFLKYGDAVEVKPDCPSGAVRSGAVLRPTLRVICPECGAEMFCVARDMYKCPVDGHVTQQESNGLS